MPPAPLYDAVWSAGGSGGFILYKIPHRKQSRGLFIQKNEAYL